MTSTDTRTTARERVLSIDARVHRIMRSRGVDRETATELMEQELNHLRAKGLDPFISDQLCEQGMDPLLGVVHPGEDFPVGVKIIPSRDSFTRDVDRMQRELTQTYRDEEYVTGRRRSIWIVLLIIALFGVGWYFVGTAVGAFDRPF